MLNARASNQSVTLQLMAAVLSLFLLVVAKPGLAQSADVPQNDDSAAVMDAFNQQAMENARAMALTEEDKHQILFVMGVALLILLGATAYFGLRMGISGDDVFLPHMVCAGLTITLAIVHAVTSIVWFFPF